MNRTRLFAYAAAAVLGLGMLLISLRVFVLFPDGPAEARFIAAALFALSPFAPILTFLLLRSIDTFERDAERMSTRDPLTGLYNQTTFWDLLEYETERAKRQDYRFSLLEIDIDNFKAINDAYGHEVGDAFLVKFSALFKTAVRKGDIPARYGGDKFVAILPVCDEAQAYSVANRLIEDLREFPHTLPDGAQVRETISVGIAVYPDHATNAKDLHLVADGMLGQAKSLGKDRLSLPSATSNLATLKSAGEKSILVMEAIREKRIVPYFQPIMDVRNGSIMAYEVLTRIVTTHDVITAADFIEAAEGMGVIGKIDYLLIEQAFEKAKRQGYNGKLFLNLSPKALVLNEFMPTVRKMLRDYGLDPSKMVFEITERDTVKNMAVIERFIRELKDEGFRFALDDFGAGYSSFLYIKTFKVDFVKVDGEFIRNLTGPAVTERAIVSNIASLASALGIKTIAEYVESEEIMGEVANAQIDYAQGYFIKRPSPDLH